MNNPAKLFIVVCDVSKIGTGGDLCDGVSLCVEYAEDSVNSACERDKGDAFQQHQNQIL